MMTNRRRNNVNNITQSLKDYTVPIIMIFLILFLVYSFFFSNPTKKVEDVENRVGINLSFDSSESKAKIYYSWGKSEEALKDTKLYKSEKIIVSEWKVKVSDWENYKFNIDKLWELKYNWDSSFSILNWNIWLDTEVDLNIDMKFLSAKVFEKSHLSFIQNEVWSTIYVVDWMVEVNLDSGKSTVLKKSEKIEISKWNSNDENLNMDNKKEAIDDFFKTSEWFIINKGESYSKEKEENSKESSTGSTVIRNLSSDNITFGNLVDESNVSSAEINIYWNYKDDEVEKIIINNKNLANINKENKSFNFDSVDVSNKENDLVFKVYDSSNELIEKFVYTVYYEGAWRKNVVNKNTIKSNKFDVDASQFSFLYPSKDWIYTTYENIVTIKWKVTAKSIDKVTVNNYRLKSFNWKTWMYHANKDFWNMEDGTNQYEIKYYSNDELVYKNYYTIVKKEWTAPKSSSWASLN